MKMARVLAASCGVVTDGTQTPEARLAANRRMILSVLDRAALFRPDFICLPELILQAGCGDFKAMARFAEPLPNGETCALVAAKARQLNAHVILPLLESEGERVYNTAALIGRDGRLIGTYRKYHATGYEILDGVTPGSEIPVWDTDCGRVGIAICFDLKFPVVGLELSRGAAQGVFFPTMFMGGQRLVSWAMDYGFHLVRCHGGGGRIVDPTGQTLAIEGQPETLTAEGVRLAWTVADLNFDHRSYHLDFHYEKMTAMVAKYGAGVSVRRMPAEGTFNLACNLPDRTVDDLESEFSLKSLRAYLDEAATIRAKALKSAGNAADRLASTPVDSSR